MASKEHITILKLPTLECQPTYYDVVFLYKILHVLNDSLTKICLLCADNVNNVTSLSLILTFLNLVIPVGSLCSLIHCIE